MPNSVAHKSVSVDSGLRSWKGCGSNPLIEEKSVGHRMVFRERVVIVAASYVVKDVEEGAVTREVGL